MDEKHKLLICKKHIICFALSTRLAVITLQFISNILLVDHKSDAFNFPKDQLNGTLFDRITHTFLGGFLRWDAQYFYHISKYGYTFENTLAFFPLLPYVTKLIATPFVAIFPFIDLTLIIFITLNTYLFVKAALALFDLTVIILNRRLAYKAAILFCVNPATIFFVAPYTESMFAYFSFTTMLTCADIYYKNNTKSNKAFASFANLLLISIPISLSVATRSNGILNTGFLIYFWVLFFKKSYWPHNIATLFHLIKCTIMLLANIIICLLPFVIFQIYAYQKFCTDFKNDIPKDLVIYANENNLILPGTFSQHNQTWCYQKIPLAYSYIQEHYWNVGFLKYYELKQLPNFALALPIVYIIVSKCFVFIRQHPNHCLNLGIFGYNFNIQSLSSKGDTNLVFDKKMFVFLLHAFGLTVFCVLCIHVQVTTRMLCSGSPILYWLCAYAFEEVNTAENELFASWKGFLFNNDLNCEQKCIRGYFVCYLIVGTVMFSNYLPWT